LTQTVATLLTPNETAALLKISRPSVYRHIASGTLPAVRVGGQLRIPSDQLVHRLVETRSGFSSDAPASHRRPLDLLEASRHG